MHTVLHAHSKSAVSIDQFLHPEEKIKKNQPTRVSISYRKFSYYTSPPYELPPQKKKKTFRQIPSVTCWSTVLADEPGHFQAPSNLLFAIVRFICNPMNGLDRDGKKGN